MMRFAAATGMLTAANGVVLLYWGRLPGGPTAITSSGGTPFQMNGVFELFFAMLLLWGVMRERHALVKEWSLFAVLCVLATFEAEMKSGQRGGASRSRRAACRCSVEPRPCARENIGQWRARAPCRPGWLARSKHDANERTPPCRPIPPGNC